LNGSSMQEATCGSDAATLAAGGGGGKAI
jgi:hypothetical protein